MAVSILYNNRFSRWIGKQLENQLDRFLIAPLFRPIEHYTMVGVIAYQVCKLRDGGAAEEEVQRTMRQYVADFKRAKEIVKK